MTQAHSTLRHAVNHCSDEYCYVYMSCSDDLVGIDHDLWVHAAGCRKYYNVTRHTVTYEILETYLIGEQLSVVADGAKKTAVHDEAASPRSITCTAAADSTATAHRQYSST
ncbi:sarcosine oxidase subunit delta [Pseudomonas aeruginosa]|nr:sarcosine oxidase subunit delta [Pseudomonas aeruginosa]